ncbi:SCO family protein [Aquabacterium sp.]|uniref:SCO family protein n=1 Tax=Aquabacterium sp. TaxID=1872578 RepID=UPI002CBDB7E1|nr:SCO family protein [Aquabacterium sp.]HSW06906.1 SCO family protein [Aquabacterium sp.]
MLRTVLASAVLVSLAGLSAAWLTEGFEVWTAEAARRRAVSQAPVAAPHAVLLGDEMSGEPLQDMLAVPGRVTIASFIYTRCFGVCLALGSSFQQLQQAIASHPADRSGDSIDDNVKLLSISFDPAHDDEAQLRRYAALWRVDPRHWRMSTVPDAGELQRLLNAWQVVVIADGLGGYEHNAALLVIDQRGRLVRIFDESDAGTALVFARRLQQPGSVAALR